MYQNRSVKKNQPRVDNTQFKKVRQRVAFQDQRDDQVSQLQAIANRSNKKTNNTGLPHQLKAGIESLSGYSMDDVKVHYNSSKPAQLNAHAYAQGTDIHVASGQEKHLAHEAWHVVQQKQGRVQPTKQLKGKVNINDDTRLEREADMMGAKALQMSVVQNESRFMVNPRSSIVQMVKRYRGGYYAERDPYTIHRTKAIATDHERDLRNKGLDRIKMRVPTMYTYTKTRSGNVLSIAKQGPHTFAHKGLMVPLQETKAKAGLKKIFNEQIIRPKRFKQILDTEVIRGTGDAGDMRARLDRAIEDYKDLYSSTSKLFRRGGVELIEIKHNMNKLMNMNPYQTRGWRRMAGTTPSSGHGEGRPNPTFNQLVDRPRVGAFNDMNGYTAMETMRRNLFNQFTAHY